MSRLESSRFSLNTLIVVIAIVCAVLAAILVGLPFLVRTDSVTAMLVREIERHLGHKIELHSVRLKIVPSLALEADGLQVQFSSGERIFSADRLEFVLETVPLLRGRFVIRRLNIERPHFRAHRDQAGHWTFIPENRRPADPKRRDGGPPVLAFLRNILLTDGRVTILDERQPAPWNGRELTAVQAVVSEGLPGEAAVKVFGKVPSGSDAAVFNLEGTLIRPSAVAGTQNEAYPVQFDGTFRIDRMDVGHIAAWSEIDFPTSGPAHLDGRFRFSSGDGGSELVVAEWKAALLDLSLRGEAAVSGIGTTVPRFSATFSSAPLQFGRWLQEIPARSRLDRLRTLLSELEADGTVAVRTATVTGTLGSPPHLAATAEIQINQGRFRLPETPTPVRGLTATVIYGGDHLSVQGVEADYGSIHLSHGDVVVEELETNPSFAVRISAQTPIAGLAGVLSPRLRSPLIDRLLPYLQQATGELRAIARLKGRSKDGVHVDLVDADVSIHDVALSDPSLPFPIRRWNGRFGFASNAVHIEQLSGRVGPAHVTVRGAVHTAGDSVYKDLNVQIVADANELTSLIRTHGAPTSKPPVDGPIRVAAAVSGRVASPHIHAFVEFGETALDIPFILTKPSGAPASMKIEGDVTDELILSVRRLAILIPPIRIIGHGRLDLSETHDFQIKLVSQPVSLQNLRRGVAVGPIRAGLLKGMLDLKGRAVDPMSVEAAGRIEFTDGLIVVPDRPMPIRNVSLLMEFTGRDVEVQRLAFKMGNSDLQASGSIASWANAPQAALLINSSQFDLGLLKPTRRRSSRSQSGAEFLPSRLRDGRMTATVFIDSAYYERFLFTGVSCRINVDRDGFSIERISGDTDDGHLAGQVIVHPPQQRNGQAEGGFRITGIPVQRMLSLFSSEEPVNGWFSAIGRLRTELGRQGVLPASLTSLRPIRFIIENGRIFKVPAISKLLAVMNLPAILQGKVDLDHNGLPFDQIRSDFSVSQGIVTFKELYLDSPILKLSAGGRYDLITDQLDMTVVASPLGSYSELLKALPVFGTLFAGKREGFATAVFDVKGPVKDPTIDYLPVESLARGVKGTAKFAFDVLVNALTLPKKLGSAAQEFLTDGD